MARVIGIDPGSNGGVAWIDTERPDRVETRRLSPLVHETVRALYEAVFLGDRDDSVFAEVWLESVHAMPKQGVVSSFTFGKNFGVILGALEAWEDHVNVHLISPSVWQNGIGISRKPMTGLEGRERKAVQYEGKTAIKQAMVERFNVRVTLNTADALGILSYGMKQLEGFAYGL